MRLTPLDIHQKEFRKGLRGYNEEDVDSFLDEVATEFEKVFQTNIDLKEQVERLQKKLAQYENFEQTMQDSMLAAQKAAEEIQNNAKRAAELIIRDAELKAKEVVQEAFAQKTEQNREFAHLKKVASEFREKFKGLSASYSDMLEDFRKEEEKLPVIEEEKQVEEKIEEMAEGFESLVVDEERTGEITMLADETLEAAEEEAAEEAAEEEAAEEEMSAADEIIRKTLGTEPEEEE